MRSVLAIIAAFWLGAFALFASEYFHGDLNDVPAEERAVWDRICSLGLVNLDTAPFT